MERRNERRYYSNSATSLLATRLNEDLTLRERSDSNEINDGEIQVLKVETCDLLAQQNSLAHRTAPYEVVCTEPYKPVLRRGQPFRLTLTFNRPYDEKTDSLRLVLGFGTTKGASKGLSTTLKITDKPKLGDNDDWDVVKKPEESADPNMILLEVMIPANANVGIWGLTVRTSPKGQPRKQRVYKSNYDIYIVFNPWCEQDDVYLEDDSWRQEFVLNDNGKVWRGSAKQFSGTPWVFGQFDASVLNCTMLLLHVAGIDPVQRGNPAIVSRGISYVVANYLLEGNWSDDFYGGTAPWAWTGSVAIMKQFLKTQESVKYGQCWVFSGLIVSACRTLGLPCRSVTNFESGHDTDQSLTIDYIITLEGELEARDTHAWNFHVWNDVWMKRRDLSGDTGVYDGWQAIDATPQEESEGEYQCGPAPVEAVRRGFVGLRYDTQFVFSEVNADKFYFKESEDDPNWEEYPVYIETDQIGTRIVTKMIGEEDDFGDTDMEDITHEYKHPEGSSAERLSVMNAVRTSTNPGVRKLYDAVRRRPHDVAFALDEPSATLFGEDFSLTLRLHNTSVETRTVACILQIHAVDYQGKPVGQVQRGKYAATMGPGQKETTSLHVGVKDYIGKVQSTGMLSAHVQADVRETRQFWFKQHKLALEKPRIDIRVSGIPKVGKSLGVVFSFKNPLPVPLTQCSFSLEGPGLIRPFNTGFRDVEPNELVQFEYKVEPRAPGERRMTATFVSRELTGVYGRRSINVLP